MATQNAPVGSMNHRGERIDPTSQKIITLLNTDEWTTGTRLRVETELEQNQQIFYRIENHLHPAGLVREKEREAQYSQPADQQPRAFKLTSHGEAWLSENEQDVATPTTRVETQQMAYEAKEAAESARESVQGYRQKLYRLKENAQENFDTVADEMDGLEGDITELDAELAELDDYVTRVDSAAGERFEEIEATHEEHAETVAERFEEQQATIERQQEEIDALTDALETLQEDVSDNNEELNQSFVDRFR